VAAVRRPWQLAAHHSRGGRAYPVVLPTTTHGRLRARCMTQPDAAQAALLDRLGIVLPKRMRLRPLAATA